ncbi:MAG: hypothetical protein CVV27_03305 [Candidatus Melainabacteria bacterium HGW-Melainabacteria-1]|nr:MAG: hypothetical protein CVV27_03305 [Candidatus Melainabacteria bacterium HGW-Melainabacteria-1]
MNEILTRSWRLLTSNWMLLSVLILETLILLVFKGGQVGMTPNLMLEMALYFFHLAVLAGWLFMIKAVLLRADHRASWDDFFNGVARYFTPLLGGGAMFLMVCLLGLLMAVSLATGLAGEPDMKLVEQFWQLLQANKTTELDKLMQQHPAVVEQLERWVGVLVAGLALLGLYALSLCFWTYWVVLGDLGWIKAWRSSQLSLRKHFKPLLFLGLVWLMPTLLIHAGLLSGLGPIQMAAFFLSLLAKVYFTLLFCHFLVLAEPEGVTPLPEQVVPPVVKL